MATRKEMLDRHNRAQEARERLKAGTYTSQLANRQATQLEEPVKTRADKFREYQAAQASKPAATPAAIKPGPFTPIPEFKPQSEMPSYMQAKPQGIGPAIQQYNKDNDIKPTKQLPGRDIPIVGPTLKFLDKVQQFTEPAAKIAEEYYTPGAGLSAIGAFRGAGEAALGRIAPKIAYGAGIGAKAGKEAILEGAAGTVLGAGQAAARHPEDAKGMLRGAESGALAGAGLGMIGSVAAPLLSKAGRALMERWRPTPAAAPEPTLNLPLGREDSIRAARGAQPGEGVIKPEYTFKLDQGSTRKPDVSAARKDLADIDTEIRTMDTHYKKAINDEYQYLKSSMGQGKENGVMTFDDLGNVTNRVGYISKNPKWYSDFKQATGKQRPSNKDLYAIAKSRVDNGFVDEQGMIPGWKADNQFDETLMTLQGVRDQINNSLRELDPALNMTDVPLKTDVLNFPKKAPKGGAAAAPTPEPTPAAVADDIEPPAPSAGPAAPPPPNTRAAAFADYKANSGAPNPGERGLYRNMRDNGQYTDEFNAQRAAADNTYEVKTDRAAVDAANEAIKDAPAAALQFLRNKSPEKEDMTIAIRLMQKLDQTGDHETALDIYNKLAADFTRGGQTSQAGSLIEKLSPEGQLLRLVRRAKEAGKEVTVAEKVEFQKQAAKFQDASGAGARDLKFNEILDKVAKGETVTEADIKYLNSFLDKSKKVVKTKDKPAPKAKVNDELPEEFKDKKKRDKIVSFLDKAEAEAMARIKARRGQLNSVPIGEWADHAIVVAAQIGRGSIKAATHVEDLVKLFGEDIRADATTVFKKAQSIVRGITRTAGAGKVDEAERIIRNLSGAAEAEKALVDEAAEHVRKMVKAAKDGTIDEEDVIKLQAYADEVSSFPEPKTKVLTPEAKYAQTVKTLLKKIKKVEAEKVPADQANREVQSLLRQVANIKEQDLVARIPDKIETDSLRKLSEAALDTKVLTPQQKVVKKFIETTPDVKEADIATLRQFSKDITELQGKNKFDADLKMQDIMNSYEKSSMYDKAVTIRYIGMLWNTTTQLVNVLSGMTRAVAGQFEDLPATFIDKLVVQHIKGERSVTLYKNNPLMMLSDIIENLGMGVRAGWKGTNPGGITNIDEVRGLVFKFNQDDNLVTKIAKSPFQLLERSLGAVAKGADYAVYKAVADRDLVAQAYLSAKNAKITDKVDIQAHMRKFLEDPPPEALLQADQMGKNTTFQRSDSTGGMTARAVNSLPMWAKVPATIIAPFIKTPINILSAGVTYTPAGALKGIFQLISPNSKAPTREALRNIGASVIGSGVMTPVGYYLNSIGVITGANDSGDKDVNAIRAQAGQDKYKLNTTALKRYMSKLLMTGDIKGAEKAAAFQKGDSQIDYNKLQPFALLPSIGASINENKDKPLKEMAGKVANDALGSITSMSMLKGIQTVVAPDYNAPAGEGSAKIGTRLAEQTLEQFSPSVLAQVARVKDPVQRKTGYNEGLWKDVTDYYKSRLPGLSKTLPALKTTLGEDKVYAKGVIAQFLNPYKSEKIPFNDAAKVIVDMIDKTGDTTLAPQAPKKEVSGTDYKTGEKVKATISDEQFKKLQEDIGKEITTKILNISSLYTDARKAERIKEIYSEAKERHLDVLRRKLGME